MVQVAWETLALLACQDDLVPKVVQVPLGTLEELDLLASQEQLVMLDPLDSQDPLENKVSQEMLAALDHLAASVAVTALASLW